MRIEIPEFSESAELNQQGGVLLANGNFQEAINYFERANKLDPMDIETYFNLGRANASIEEYDEAEKYFKKVILIDKSNPMIYFELGNISFLKDNFEKGLEYYNKAISNGYDESNLYFNLGMIYEELENYNMSIRNYTKAIERDKFNPEYRLKQVSAYVKNDNYDEALEALDEVNQFCPDIFEGYHLTFEIYCAQGKYKEAENIINKAIDMFPKDVSLFYDKIKLTNIIGEHDKALEMINEVEQMEDYDIEQRNIDFERAKIYAQKEDTENTIKSLQKVISYEDGEFDYEARYFLMNTYLCTKNYEMLLEQAKILSEQEDGETQYVMSAIYYKALSLDKLGKKDEAKEEYKYAIKVFRSITISNPTELDAFMFRILCHKDTKEYDKALELLDYVQMLKSDSADVYAIKSAIYKELGDGKKAEENMILAKKYNEIFQEYFD